MTILQFRKRPEYRLRTAKSEHDLEAVSVLLSSVPNLRRLPASEIRKRMDNGVFLLVETVKNGTLVGTIHIADTGQVGEYELGGAYVLESEQHRRLFWLLCRAAIASLFLVEEGTPRLVGHVLASNPEPRMQMEDLGFEIEVAGAAYPPSEYPGLEHMPTNADGDVVADLYVLRASAFCSAVSELKKANWALTGGDSVTRRVVNEVMALEPAALEAALEKCAELGHQG